MIYRMTFEGAMSAVREGYSVRRGIWARGEALAGQLIHTHYRNYTMSVGPWHPERADILADDWLVLEE